MTRFSPCLPEMRRAKAIDKGGCPHPDFCTKKGECYYGHEPGKVIDVSPESGVDHDKKTETPQ